MQTPLGPESVTEFLLSLYWKARYAADRVRAAAMRARSLSGEHVLVVGSPRSGTSWLMHLIAQRPDFCALFEPMHPRWWSGVREAGFGDRPWRGDVRKRQFLQQVLSGAKASRRPRFSPRVDGDPGRLLRGAVQRLWATRLVVKFVRACRLLPWMVSEFLNHRYVYVVRNPYAVVNSQLRAGISSYVDDGPRPYDLLNEDRQAGSQMDLLCERIRCDAAQVLDQSVVRQIDSLEGCLALSWYADNLVAQHVANHEAVLSVRYEALLTNTEAELDRIQTHIGADLSLPAEIGAKDPNRQLRKWKAELTDAQVDRIREALRVLEQAHGPIE